MTAAAHSDTRRKRLLWRASHRGIREMDLILGGFATARIDTMTPAELDQLGRSRLLEEMLAFRS